VLFYYPADDVTVVLLSNVTGRRRRFCRSGKSATSHWDPRPVAADLPVSAAEQQRVAGKYSSPLFPFEMVARGGKIALAGLSAEPMPLARQADGSYLAAWDPQFHFVPGAACRIRSGAIVPLTFKCSKVWATPCVAQFIGPAWPGPTEV
jgi:hypothetical protein